MLSQDLCSLKLNAINNEESILMLCYFLQYEI